VHPITIEYLAHDHIAELRRDANQPHVPERDRAVAGRTRARDRVGAAIAAVVRLIDSIRRVRRSRRSRRPDPSPVH
jgi:hypothetical protein